MATTLIRNGCLSGAVAGIMSQRVNQSFTPADYANIANVADAIAAECITRNAALTVPMADADNALIGQLCQGAAIAVCAGVPAVSTTATDYVAIANQIVAAAKQAVPKLV
jgi:hypothetical protein